MVTNKLVCSGALASGQNFVEENPDMLRCECGDVSVRIYLLDGKAEAVRQQLREGSEGYVL
jgi:hypothetical protein